MSERAGESGGAIAMKRARPRVVATEKVASLLESIDHARQQIETLLSGLQVANAEAKSEVSSERESLEEQAQALQDEIAMMEQQAGSLGERVKLDIGGHRFTTSRTTLCARESMLATMFSGRHQIATDEDGYTFIDRDGRNFHHILNFLRTGEIMLPETEAARRELLAEADFYQFTALLEILGRGRFERELGALNVAMRERETELRRLFAQEPKHPRLLAPHLDLVDVFANLDSFRPAHDESWQQLSGHMMLHGEHRLKHGTLLYPEPGYRPDEGTVALLSMRQWAKLDERRAVARSVCSDLATFRETFSHMTSQRLDGFDMSNMVVAGGSVLASLLFSYAGDTPTADVLRRQRSKYLQGMNFNDSDIDIFLIGLSEAAATQRIQDLYDHLRAVGGDTTVVRTKLAVTFIQDRLTNHRMPRVIQVVLRIYQSPAEVLAGFDVDACCVAYDGERVWASSRARRAINGMVNVADESRQSLTYESRLFKYSARGFAVCVPGFDSSRVPLDLFDRNIGDVHGVAKLLLLERLTDSRSAFNMNRKDGEHDQPEVVRVHPMDKCRYNWNDHRRMRASIALSAISDPHVSDYSGYTAKVKYGYHPYGTVCTFIDGAIERNEPVPCVASRNDLSVILDAGGEARSVSMDLWLEALQRYIFGVNWHASAGDADRTPDELAHMRATKTFTPSVPRFIEYVTHDAGRQLVGSFHPTDRDFFADAYDDKKVVRA